MLKTTVVIIGGGSTGVGILRDLSMRGVDTILIEQDDLGYWTSSRFHGYIVVEDMLLRIKKLLLNV